MWGGNLSVLVSLLGTPYWPEVKGGVLFIEDVNEHPFRIERMLTQLLHAGVLARQKAIVFGQFTGIRLAPHDKGYKLATVVAWLRSQLKVPVLTGLPFGHVPTKVLLPVGAKVDLLVEGRDALMVWGHSEVGAAALQGPATGRKVAKVARRFGPCARRSRRHARRKHAVNRAPRRSSSCRARASPCCSARAAISSLRAYHRA